MFYGYFYITHKLIPISVDATTNIAININCVIQARNALIQPTLNAILYTRSIAMNDTIAAHKPIVWYRKVVKNPTNKFTKITLMSDVFPPINFTAIYNGIAVIIQIKINPSHCSIDIILGIY